MGAGKSTLGAHVAKRLGRPFVDIDTEIERRASTSVSAIFATQGEVEFRAIEQRLASEVLDSDPPVVVSLGGGAPVSPQTTSKLAERALTVLLDVDVDEAWRRARRSDRRPLAQSETIFRELYDTAPAVLRACRGPQGGRRGWGRARRRRPVRRGRLVRASP